VSESDASTQPYAQGALIYFSRGWTDVFPVGTDKDPYAKAPVPKGVTGYDAGPVGWDRIKLGTQQAAGRRNLGLRMPRQVIALDVDEYEDHTGAETLAKAEATLGTLPATYRNTARGRGDAGHRFYRTGMGRIAIPGAEEILAKAYGPNIEILHYGRRYAVAWPSLNAAAGLAPYRWYAPGGELLDGPPPRVIDLPVLPEAWQELLTAPIGSEQAQRASGGNLRAERKATAADEGEALWDEAGLTIRRSKAQDITMSQVVSVLEMKVGEVNKTLGSAGIWLARMANAGLFTLEQAEEILTAATLANGVNSDSWNVANKRRWTMRSRIADALSQGLNRPAYSIINDQPATNVHPQLMRRIAR
jgi:bifunctional DNA primase/polymerase-like protein